MLFVYMFLITNIGSNIIGRLMIYKRLQDEDYVFLDTSMSSELISLFVTGLQYLIPGYNVYLLYNIIKNFDKVYEDNKNSYLKNNIIISKEELEDINKKYDELRKKTEEVLKDIDINPEVVDKTVLINYDKWNNMSNEEKKQLLIDILDKEKTKNENPKILEKKKK